MGLKAILGRENTNIFKERITACFSPARVIQKSHRVMIAIKKFKKRIKD